MEIEEATVWFPPPASPADKTFAQQSKEIDEFGYYMLLKSPETSNGLEVMPGVSNETLG